MAPSAERRIARKMQGLNADKNKERDEGKDDKYRKLRMLNYKVSKHFFRPFEPLPHNPSSMIKS
jgi:hypothetical protein